MTRVPAIDISNYFGGLDAAALAALDAADVGYVIVRGSLEHPETTALAQAQLAALQAAGRRRGVYLWAYLDDGAPEACVAAALGAFEAYAPDCYWLDVEDETHCGDVATNQDWVRRALAAFDAAGKRVGLYANAWYWHDYLGNSVEFVDRPFWLADYDQRANLTQTRSTTLPWPAPWTGKQYSDKGSLAGHTVDLSVFDLACDEGAPMGHRYDPDWHTPAYQQHNAWTCSVCATAWLLGALGFAMTPAALQDAMVGAGLVNEAKGLLYGDGSQLEAWLQGTYGLRTERSFPASFDWVHARAGRGALIMGAGLPFYHWIGVRRTIDDDTIGIVNSAEGYEKIYQTLTRAQFQTLGTFAAIWVVPAAEEEDPAMIEALQQQIADAKALIDQTQGPWVDAAIEAVAAAKDTVDAAERSGKLDAALAALATIKNGG